MSGVRSPRSARDERHCPATLERGGTPPSSSAGEDSSADRHAAALAVDGSGQGCASRADSEAAELLRLLAASRC